MPAIKLARLEERTRGLRLRLGRFSGDLALLSADIAEAGELPGNEALIALWRLLAMEVGELALALGETEHWAPPASLSPCAMAREPDPANER